MMKMCLYLCSHAAASAVAADASCFYFPAASIVLLALIVLVALFSINGSSLPACVVVGCWLLAVVAVAVCFPIRYSI